MEFEKALGEKGAFLLEAPITGGLDALRKGQMAVWVAGDKATFKAVGNVPQLVHGCMVYKGHGLDFHRHVEFCGGRQTHFIVQ